MNLTVIAGNGLSIAFSNELTLSAITNRVVAALEGLAPEVSPAMAAIREIAARIEGSPDDIEDDFEKLVGSLEIQAGLLHSLEELIDLAPEGRDELISALKLSADFAHRLYDLGTGVVLQDILDHSPHRIAETEHLHPFFEAIVEDFSGTITFANLNYDGLAMAALQHINAPVCDMARGYSEVEVSVTNKNDDGTTVELGKYVAYPLRKSLNFPEGDDYRLRLIHLHGSISFWEDRETGRRVKIPIELLRDHEVLFNRTVERRNFNPTVILANSSEKPRRTMEMPFSLGYEALSLGLAESEHWLIVGYSFRDSSVNDRLREAFMQSDPKPRVLVSTHGDTLSRKDIEIALGWGVEDLDSRDWLIIDRGGVAGLDERRSWNSFRG